MPAPKPIPPGTRFGRLLVIRQEQGKRKHLCQCDCGAVKLIGDSNLRQGITRSCGCLRREGVAAKNFRHGARKRSGGPPEYYIWKRMRQRCKDPNNHEWDRYGGRGIGVDPRWDSFAAFLEDMGSRPSPKHSIDRIDNELNYGPSNCRWATASEQARNKRKTLKVEFGGAVVTIADLADMHSMPYGRLYTRLAKGWSVERAVSTPIQSTKRR